MPYGFSQNHQGYAQPQQHGHVDLSAPPPPHSLAPVAMGSDRSHAGSVGSTNAHLAQTVVIREKPSIKWGVMIALTGALLGGVLGLGLDAHRQAQRAAAAAGDRESALSMSATLPTQAAVNGLTAAPAIPVATPLTSNGVVTPAAPLPIVSPLPIAARAPVVLPPSQPVAVTKAEPPAKPDKHAAARPAPVRHQGFVAAKVTAPKPAPEKVEAPAKPEVKSEPAKTAKADKADKADKGAPGAAPGDARKVLEDAIKDTTNTL